MLRGIWQRVVVATVLAGAIASVLSAQQPAFAQGHDHGEPSLFKGPDRVALLLVQGARDPEMERSLAELLALQWPA